MGNRFLGYLRAVLETGMEGDRDYGITLENLPRIAPFENLQRWDISNSKCSVRNE
jgi:hypothetical protein